MNREDIILMAREAGWTGPEENVTYVAMLERFAALVAAAEREECAKICDAYIGADPIADAIRARGEQ